MAGGDGTHNYQWKMTWKVGLYGVFGGLTRVRFMVDGDCGKVAHRMLG